MKPRTEKTYDSGGKAVDLLARLNLNDDKSRDGGLDISSRFSFPGSKSRSSSTSYSVPGARPRGPRVSSHAVWNDQTPVQLAEALDSLGLNRKTRQRPDSVAASGNAQRPGQIPESLPTSSERKVVDSSAKLRLNDDKPGNSGPNVPSRFSSSGSNSKSSSSTSYTSSGARKRDVRDAGQAASTVHTLTLLAEDLDSLSLNGSAPRHPSGNAQRQDHTPTSSPAHSSSGSGPSGFLEPQQPSLGQRYPPPAASTPISTAETGVLLESQPFSTPIRPMPPMRQCSGSTGKGERCQRMIQEYKLCDQHSKIVLRPNGFFARCQNENGQGLGRQISEEWINFADYIPPYLDPTTQVALRELMTEPRSDKDEKGVVYGYEVQNPKDQSPHTISFKIGRTRRDVQKRIAEWKKQCWSTEPKLRGYYPGGLDYDSVNTVSGSVMEGRIKGGVWCHRLERLVHLELADLAINRPYLRSGWEAFTKGSGNGKKYADMHPQYVPVYVPEAEKILIIYHPLYPLQLYLLIREIVLPVACNLLFPAHVMLLILCFQSMRILFLRFDSQLQTKSLTLLRWISGTLSTTFRPSVRCLPVPP
ncbi:hypothetical protein GYMLUDRAFT_589125 [Collybiopsis luxurians FD-317 M1]|uniref:Uncharacterized protein n=1 Tax=Collybiopsis luxurians FD-317 M1 TaxID=944289 RepID=A0A0D0CXV5_9AGAR|nr:hypothetical protein GYMLUDRAFT_589125 [Collybiopsis luxurians FD-317 M1]